MSPEQFEAFVAAESQKFAGVIEKANIKLRQLSAGGPLWRRTAKIRYHGGSESPAPQRRIAMDAVTPKGQAQPRTSIRIVVKPAEMEWKPTRFPGCEVKTLLFDPQDRPDDRADALCAGRGAAGP